MHRFNHDSYLHSLYQSPRHAQQMSYYQQHQASSSAENEFIDVETYAPIMGPPENTPVQPQTVNNGQSIAVAHDPINNEQSMAIAQAPRSYSSRLNSAAENEFIDVET